MKEEKEDKSVLGGFESIMEKFQSGFVPGDDEPDPIPREPGDDELDPPAVEPIEPKQEDEPIEEINGEDVESEYVSDMFDVFAEKYGWDEQDKPKSIEDLLEYVDNQIQSKNNTEFATDEIRELNEFVSNGGKLEDYFEYGVSTDYSAMDLSKESNQKKILTDLFKRQGLTDIQIERKLDKYEMADILQDEAEEAVEMLQEIQEKEKEQLLKDQQRQKEEFSKAQQDFYKNVTSEVNSLDEIRGIKIPAKDKKELLDYIFKPTKSGKTQYQEDYASSITNLVESAYFTKNKKQLIDLAKKEGEKTAVERFKQKLKSGNIATSKKTINSGEARSFLDLI